MIKYCKFNIINKRIVSCLVYNYAYMIFAKSVIPYYASIHNFFRVILRYNYEYMSLYSELFLAMHKCIHSQIYLHEIIHAYLFPLSLINSIFYEISH